MSRAPLEFATKFFTVQDLRETFELCIREMPTLGAEDIKKHVCTETKVLPEEFDKWIVDHPELIAKVAKNHMLSRLRARHGMYLKAQDEGDFNLKLEERLDPRFKAKQDVNLSGASTPDLINALKELDKK